MVRVCRHRERLASLDQRRSLKSMQAAWVLVIVGALASVVTSHRAPCTSAQKSPTTVRAIERANPFSTGNAIDAITPLHEHLVDVDDLFVAGAPAISKHHVSPCEHSERAIDLDDPFSVDARDLPDPIKRTPRPIDLENPFAR